MPEIISRKEARALGLKRFFTGKPCPKGHVLPRYLASGKCIGCASLEQSARWEKRCPNMVHLGSNIACKICGCTFVKTERSQKTCSPECKHRNQLLLGSEWRRRLPESKRAKLMEIERYRARQNRANWSVEQVALRAQRQRIRRQKQILAYRALRELGIEI